MIRSGARKSVPRYEHLRSMLSKVQELDKSPRFDHTYSLPLLTDSHGGVMRKILSFLFVLLGIHSHVPTAVADVPIASRFESNGRLGYFVTGAPLAIDTGVDGRVDVMAEPANATVNLSDLPLGASLVQAFLYWSGTQTQGVSACSGAHDDSVLFASPGNLFVAVGEDTSYCTDSGAAAYDIWVSRANFTSLIATLTGT